MKCSTTKRRVIICALLAPVLLGSESLAQQRPPPPPSLITPPPVDLDAAGSIQELAAEDPYWEETVARALEQLQSENAEERRSAVMLLGKYPVPPAREALARALGDDAAPVRRAALVSLLEEQGPITPAMGVRMLRLLGDPDVSIRRIASNAVPMMVQHLALTMLPGDVQPRRDMPAEATEILRAAFGDPDVTVRRNMVAHYPFLRVRLSQETIVSLLHDSDDEVAIHALRWGLPLLEPRQLADEAQRLTDHENPLFRLELARALQGQPIPGAEQALETLQNDEHPAVAIEAMLAVFHLQPSPQLYENLLQRYRESGGRTEAAQRIIFAAQLLGKERDRFLREWLQDENPSHRQQAAMAYLGRMGTQPDMDFLLSLLEDSAPGVRQQAVQAMMRANQQLQAEHVAKAIASRYADVRRMAAGLTSFLQPPQAEELLMDLLLDEATEVRVAALQQIGNRRFVGWEEIMVLSLEEENPAIRQSSLQWLARQPTEEGIRLLREYLNRNPDPALRPQIETVLRRAEALDQT